MLLFCERKSALKNEWERGRRGRKKEQEVEREKKRKKQRFSSINLRFFCLLYANSSFWILSSRIISSVASFSLSSNAPSVVMGSSSSRVDFELWQNKICFFKVFRKIEEILSNRFESSKMKKKKNRIKESSRLFLLLQVLCQQLYKIYNFLNIILAQLCNIHDFIATCLNINDSALYTSTESYVVSK